MTLNIMSILCSRFSRSLNSFMGPSSHFEIQRAIFSADPCSYKKVGMCHFQKLYL